MVVHLHTICYNERDLMEIAIKYWASSVSHVFVYLMSSSNDGSKEFLSEFGKFISVIPIKDENEFNDARNIYIKNNCWKASRGKADFVIVTDFDEFIYAKDIIKELEYMKENNMTIVAPEIYHLTSKENIIDKLNYNIFLHEQVREGYYDPKFGKYCLFDPNAIEEINYLPGAHQCQPVGKIKYYDRNKIFLFHAKYLGEERFVNRLTNCGTRLSQMNIQNNWGVEYNFSEENKRKIFNDKYDNRVNISERLL